MTKNTSLFSSALDLGRSESEFSLCFTWYGGMGEASSSVGKTPRSTYYRISLPLISD